MNELFNLFEELGFANKYFEQGTLSNDYYPDSFFTFSNFASPYSAYYDDDNRQEVLRVQVSFYTNNREILYSTMDQFIKAAKTAKMVVKSGAYDVPSGRVDYYGRTVEINIIRR